MEKWLQSLNSNFEVLLIEITVKCVDIVTVNVGTNTRAVFNGPRVESVPKSNRVFRKRNRFLTTFTFLRVNWVMMFSAQVSIRLSANDKSADVWDGRTSRIPAASRQIAPSAAPWPLGANHFAQGREWVLLNGFSPLHVSAIPGLRECTVARGVKRFSGIVGLGSVPTNRTTGARSCSTAACREALCTMTASCFFQKERHVLPVSKSFGRFHG